ncbi:MAG: class II aldolase/adducin family protein [Planctomycetes bacterium]|jgi:L-fuculose-phosphate aldolase|nr:class II aldolase/adducin family protein [Planctomycetota bacterium]
MNGNSWQMKKQLCDIGERIWLKGFCAGNEGNHSVRIAEDRILITASGVSKGMLKPEHIIACDMDGHVVDRQAKCKPSSERKVHIAVYKHRPDVKAVIHSHPPHATAFAVANIPLPEGIHPEAEVFLGRVPIAAYATPSTEELPNSILPLIGPETNTVLMGNHGSVSFSTDLTDAYYKLEILDAYCRILLLSKQVGAINTLSNEQMAELLQVKEQFGLTDPRSTCALDGCVGGRQNEPFLAGFDVRPSGASCTVNGGPVEQRHTGRAAGAPAGEADFERMVQTITDQIMGQVGASN